MKNHITARQAAQTQHKFTTTNTSNKIPTRRVEKVEKVTNARCWQVGGVLII